MTRLQRRRRCTKAKASTTGGVAPTPSSSDPRRPHLRWLFCFPRPRRLRLRRHRLGALTSLMRSSWSPIPMNHELPMSPRMYVRLTLWCPTGRCSPLLAAGLAPRRGSRRRRRGVEPPLSVKHKLGNHLDQQLHACAPIPVSRVPPNPTAHGVGIVRYHLLCFPAVPGGPSGHRFGVVRCALLPVYWSSYPSESRRYEGE